MDISIEKIREKRKKSKDAQRSEDLVIPIFVARMLSVYGTYIFLKLSVKADTISLVGNFFTIIGSTLFVCNYPLLGACGLVMFHLLDCCDGEVARFQGPSSYGAIYDSFGADIFYAFAPLSVGVFLGNSGIVILSSEGNASNYYIVIIGALVSATFLLYRLFTFKLSLFFSNIEHTNRKEISSYAIKEHGILFKLTKAYKNQSFKNNFFSTAGISFIVLILVMFRLYEVLAFYLLAMLLYNIGYTIISYLQALYSFRNAEE